MSSRLWGHETLGREGIEGKTGCIVISCFYSSKVLLYAVYFSCCHH